MTKKILALSLIAAFAAAPAVSLAAQPAGDFFINGQVGQSYLRGMTASNDTATGSSFNAGYRWNINPTLQFGVEAGYANTGTYSDSAYATTVKGQLEGTTIGVTSRFLFGNNWYMNLDGGYFSAKQKVSGSGSVYTVFGSVPFSYSESHTMGSYYVSMGFGYNFNKHVSLGVNASEYGDKDSQFDLTSNLYGVDLEVRF